MHANRDHRIGGDALGTQQSGQLAGAGIKVGVSEFEIACYDGHRVRGFLRLGFD
jgi:hypothetical protein